MKRSWIRRFIAVLALLTSTLGARSSAAWYCEGRICGDTPWECCCAPDSTSCDLPSELRGAIQDSGSEGCSTACSCVMVEKALDQNLATRQTIPLAESPVADLPLPGASDAAPSDHKPFEFDTRGPPARTVAFLPLGLRAPPAA